MTVKHRSGTSLFILILFGAIASGCGHDSLIKAGDQIQIDKAFKVQSGINWNKVHFPGLELWTIDGPQLQRLRFIAGLKHDGSLLIRAWPNNENRPEFKSSMTPPEIMELIEATFARMKCFNIETSGLRPCKFGGLDGFRFEIYFCEESGLEYKGFMVGAKKDEKLLGIIYVGTALYHYEKHLKDAEKIVESVEILNE